MKAARQDAVEHAGVDFGIPGILPSENGTGMRLYRPGAVVPTMTIAFLNRAGLTSGFSPASICFSE